jgi:hypothetical protein
MYARVTTVRTDGGGETAARIATVASTELVPRMLDLPGCGGALLLNDPVSGTLQVISLWDSAESLVTSQAFEESARARGQEALGTVVEQTVAVYDVTLCQIGPGAVHDRHSSQEPSGG